MLLGFLIFIYPYEVCNPIHTKGCNPSNHKRYGASYVLNPRNHKGMEPHRANDSERRQAVARRVFEA